MIQKYLVNIEDFKVLDPIGVGGFGKVYLIEHKKTHEKFAAKVSVNRYLTYQEQMVFFSEIEILSKVQNPAILTFFGFSLTNFHQENYPTILTKYMPQGSLDSILESERHACAPLDWNNTKKYINILGIAIGMKHLHSQSIIHRDLKPGNVLLDESFYPRICDFGISKLSDNNLSGIKMSTNTGTLYYMAPEIIAEKEYNYKVDVYSYSLIVYELITGNLPIVDSGSFKQMQSVLNGKRPDVSMIKDQAALQFLQKCWSNDPEERPNFKEIVDSLCSEQFYSHFDIDEEEVNYYLEQFEDENLQLIPDSKKSEVSTNKENDEKEEEEKKEKINESDSIIKLRSKVTFVGVGKCGKTSMINTFYSGSFSSAIEPTVAPVFSRKNLHTKQGNVELEIWDTNCNEFVLRLLPMYMKHSNAIVIVVDVTDENWKKEFDLIFQLVNQMDHSIHRYIAANKCDAGIKINVDELKKLAEENGCFLFMTSAKEVDTVNEMFVKIANDLINDPSIVADVDDAPSDENQNQNQNDDNQAKKGKCTIC